MSPGLWSSELSKEDRDVTEVVFQAPGGVHNVVDHMQIEADSLPRAEGLMQSKINHANNHANDLEVSEEGYEEQVKDMFEYLEGQPAERKPLINKTLEKAKRDISDLQAEEELAAALYGSRRWSSRTCSTPSGDSR